MSLKVLVIGELYSENLGDGVICENVKHLIEKYVDNVSVDLLDLSGREGFNMVAVAENKVEYKTGYKAKLKKYFADKNRSFLKSGFNRIVYAREKMVYRDKIANITKQIDKDYDFAVFAGGQLFLDYFLIYMEAVMEVLSEKNIPVIFNACGFGDIVNDYKLNKFKKILSMDNVISITVRDYVDKVNNKILKGNKLQATQTSDAGLWSKETYGITDEKTSRKIGIGVIYRNDILFMNQQKELLMNIIKDLDNKNVEWELFTNGGLDDQSFAQDFFEDIHSERKKMAPRSKTPSELVELISTYDSIISFRLHSHIVATSLQVPSIAIFWDKKVNFFFETYGAEDRCFTVNSRAGIIVDKLLAIRTIPLNEEILNKEKEQAKRKLYDNISKVMNG